MRSAPSPSITARASHRPKPGACLTPISGGIASSWRAVTPSSSAGPQTTPAVQPQAVPQTAASRPRRARPEANAQSGVFDFYLLTLSWSPEYCLSHPGDVQCAPAPGFVLHGLWPENTNGTYPENCSNAPGPSNPGQYSDLYPDLGLLEHEWQTHGTCSGLAADAYFTLERQAVQSIHIPAALASKNTPAQETPGALLGSFAQANAGDPVGDFALSCGNNRLTAVQVCLDKNLHAMSCASVRSCAANVVKITAPGATGD